MMKLQSVQYLTPKNSRDIASGKDKIVRTLLSTCFATIALLVTASAHSGEIMNQLPEHSASVAPISLALLAGLIMMGVERRRKGS